MLSTFSITTAVTFLDPIWHITAGPTKNVSVQIKLEQLSLQTKVTGYRKRFISMGLTQGCLRELLSTLKWDFVTNDFWHDVRPIHSVEQRQKKVSGQKDKEDQPGNRYKNNGTNAMRITWDVHTYTHTHTYIHTEHNNIKSKCLSVWNPSILVTSISIRHLNFCFEKHVPQGIYFTQKGLKSLWLPYSLTRLLNTCSFWPYIIFLLYFFFLLQWRQLK